MAVLRLYAGLKNKTTALRLLDFTFWLPEVLVFSCLEIDFAIMCASMPIFWPTVMATWTQIFVTQEVLITRDRRSALIAAQEQVELQRSRSLGSFKSTEGLVNKARKDSVGKSMEGKSFFIDGFDVESGRGPGSGLNEVDVTTKA